jgi:hypothetical protein
MTKILLTGITLAVMLCVLGSSAQGFAMPMPYNAQSDILAYALAKNATLDSQLILVSDAPTTKGGMATFHLIPRPQTGVDGILVTPQTDSAQLILASIPTTGGGTMLKWIPRPQEGIDGITLPSPIPHTTSAIQTRSASLPETVLTSVQTSGGGMVLKLMPKTQEGIDGIPILPPAGNPMMLVSEPITSKGGMSILHLVPKPAPNSLDSSS